MTSIQAREPGVRIRVGRSPHPVPRHPPHVWRRARASNAALMTIYAPGPRAAEAGQNDATGEWRYWAAMFRGSDCECPGMPAGAEGVDVRGPADGDEVPR